MDLPKKTVSIFIKVSIFHKNSDILCFCTWYIPFYRVFLFTIHKISLKKKHPPKKRSRLQCPMKLTSSPNELSFDAHRSLYTPKAQLARTKCKLGYISLSSQIVKKLLRHFWIFYYLWFLSQIHMQIFYSHYLAIRHKNGKQISSS